MFAGHNEIFSLEETSTCEYEVLVLTPLLCKHPDYRAESAQEKEIKCVPLNPPSSSAAGSTSEKPADLQALEKANDEYREKFANAFEGTFTSDGKGTVKISFKQVKHSGSPPVQGTVNGNFIASQKGSFFLQHYKTNFCFNHNTSRKSSKPCLLVRLI